MNPIRGKARILKPHTPVTTGNERWDDYHEWVSRSDGVNDCEILDKLGRRNNGGWIRWDYWRCNNTDCGALALVSAVAVEDTVRTWLPNLDRRPDSRGGVMDDEMANNILATGAMWASLHKAGIFAEPVMKDGNATNSLIVRFEFLKSPYRVTMERIPDDDDSEL